MLHKSELQDWLNNPVTQAFQKALELESQESREDLTNELDANNYDAEKLHELVTISKATRFTYGQFYGESAKETITNMLQGFGLLEEEEDKDDSN